MTQFMLVLWLIFGRLHYLAAFWVHGHWHYPIPAHREEEVCMECKLEEEEHLGYVAVPYLWLLLGHEEYHCQCWWFPGSQWCLRSHFLHLHHMGQQSILFWWQSCGSWTSFWRELLVDNCRRADPPSKTSRHWANKELGPLSHLWQQFDLNIQGEWFLLNRRSTCRAICTKFTKICKLHQTILQSNKKAILNLLSRI